ncbi:phage regulatory CII family protein [Photobacterium sp. DA100]|uniref:phage regulatory CII family protein n=1 Tax=Photobacterium sp. DA100 TaxID=3027472 RepID=UPI0024789791|nr:phage regulatory CII family protein [Photobacterium sp. DA100]WEM43492.1 phage regulatory CII family protein [Photobacterium sp. DA100]
MSANECPKHTAFLNACTTFSNTHVIKHLAAKFGLDAQMQCNKLDANKPHKLFAEELLLLTKATYNPDTGKMDTSLVDGLLRELNLTAVPLPAANTEQATTSLTDRMLEISSATGELSAHTLQINATNRVNRRTKEQVVKRAQCAVRELVMLMNEVEGKFQAVPVLSCAVDAFGSMPLPGLS